MGYDNSWDREEFREGFTIKINHMENAPSHTMEFDMIGARPDGCRSAEWFFLLNVVVACHVLCVLHGLHAQHAPNGHMVLVAGRDE